MIIKCTSCGTRFRADRSLIKKTGTRVRCSNCQSVFTVFLPDDAPGAPDGAPDPIPRPRPRGGAGAGPPPPPPRAGAGPLRPPADGRRRPS
jgi:predicted Zn finger-like uncharacterized protein